MESIDYRSSQEAHCITGGSTGNAAGEKMCNQDILEVVKQLKLELRINF